MSCRQCATICAQVEPQTIAENDYNLAVKRYFEVVITDNSRKYSAIVSDLNKIKKEKIYASLQLTKILHAL